MTIVQGANLYVEQKIANLGTNVFQVGRLPFAVVDFTVMNRAQRNRLFYPADMEAVAENCVHCGYVGGALNAAVALARLGCEVSALFKLGIDARAEIVLSRINTEGISDRWIVRDAEAPTGASVTPP